MIFVFQYLDFLFETLAKNKLKTFKVLFLVIKLLIYSFINKLIMFNLENKKILIT